MGTDGYRWVRRKNLTVLTTSSSVQIQSFGLTAPRGVQSTRFIGRLSLTRAACVLALSEQREAEKPDPEKAGCKAPVPWGDSVSRSLTCRPARKYRAARLNFSKPVAKERIEHP